MDTRSFTIPASNQKIVEEQIEKLNRRAAKLGLDAITLTWGKAILNDKDELLAPCDVTGPLTVSYDGWEFIATLQHLPTGENIIRAISDEYMIPLEYRESGSACEHCNTKRYRKDTYVVRHHSGEVKQVGSTCIKDFLGGNSPDNIMQRAGFVGELISFMEWAGNSPRVHDEGIFHIVSFLAQTAACIRDYGWLSKTKANESGGTATAIRVQNNFSLSPGEKTSVVTAADKQLAKEAAEWAENISDSDAEISDYLYNIRAIARSGMVGWRTMGYAASIVSSYKRTQDNTEANSDHIGTIKVRQEFDLTLKRMSSGVSVYGEYHMFIFNDEQGNVVVWRASNPPDLEEGKSYRIKGTVKAHTEYKSVKQTEINRCEIVMAFA